LNALKKEVPMTLLAVEGRADDEPIELPEWNPPSVQGPLGQIHVEMEPFQANDTIHYGPREAMPQKLYIA
jgi:hypothetical protein